MSLTVYLSNPHRLARADYRRGKGLDVRFTAPVTDHGASDDCGVDILGPEPDKFWHDHKGQR